MPAVWCGTIVMILLVIAIPMICIHKNGASQVTVLIPNVEGWRRRPGATPPAPSPPGHDADRQAQGLPPYGHTVEPRLRTVASQVMLPMVTPSKVARVPNLRSTSVPLSTMLDTFD